MSHAVGLNYRHLHLICSLYVDSSTRYFLLGDYPRTGDEEIKRVTFDSYRLLK